MGQINTTNVPEYLPDVISGSFNQRLSLDSTGFSAVSFAQDEPQDDFQFVKFNAVLSGLKKGATAMRGQILQVTASVRTGNYHVDSIQVSRSIVGDCLAVRVRSL